MEPNSGSEFVALAAKIDELSQVCARLSRENAELRTRISQLSSVNGQAASPSAGAGEPGDTR